MRATEPGEYTVTSPPAVAGDLVIVGLRDRRQPRRRAEPASCARSTRAAARCAGRGTRSRAAPTTRRMPSGARRRRRAPARRTPGRSSRSTRSATSCSCRPAAPSPDYYGGERHGDNRYANSVVALRAATGEVVWHFQSSCTTTSGTTTCRAAGAGRAASATARDVPAVVQATKMGLLFVLDRETGAPLFPRRGAPGAAGRRAGRGRCRRPSRSRRAAAAGPAGAVAPGRRLGLHAVGPRRCREQIARFRTEGIFTPPSLQGTIVNPGLRAAARTGAASRSTRAPARDRQRDAGSPMVVRLMPRADFERGARGRRPARTREFAPQAGTPYGMRREPLLSPLGLPCTAPPWGTLSARSTSATGTIRWQVPLGTHRSRQIPLALRLGLPEPRRADRDRRRARLHRRRDGRRAARLRRRDRRASSGSAALPAGGQATPMTYRLRRDRPAVRRDRRRRPRQARHDAAATT